MTSARASLSQPPLVLADGRLLIYPDGEYLAFLRDGTSWTTGVLDARDIGQLQQFMPTLYNNTHLHHQEATA